MTKQKTLVYVEITHEPGGIDLFVRSAKFEQLFSEMSEKKTVKGTKFHWKDIRFYLFNTKKPFNGFCTVDSDVTLFPVENFENEEWEDEYPIMTYLRAKGIGKGKHFKLSGLFPDEMIIAYLEAFEERATEVYTKLSGNKEETTSAIVGTHSRI